MEVLKIPTDNSAHINKNIKSNIPMYRILFLKLVVQLITKLIPVLRRVSKKPIIIKSDKFQLTSSVIIIPINGTNNKKRG